MFLEDDHLKLDETQYIALFAQVKIVFDLILRDPITLKKGWPSDLLLRPKTCKWIKVKILKNVIQKCVQQPKPVCDEMKVEGWMEESLQSVHRYINSYMCSGCRESLAFTDKLISIYAHSALHTTHSCTCAYKRKFKRDHVLETAEESLHFSCCCLPGEK